MVKITIFYQDLTREMQDELWTRVRHELLAQGEVAKHEEETEDEFARRLEEEVDDYINRNNDANPFYL